MTYQSNPQRSGFRELSTDELTAVSGGQSRTREDYAIPEGYVRAPGGGRASEHFMYPIGPDGKPNFNVPPVLTPRGEAFANGELDRVDERGILEDLAELAKNIGCAFLFGLCDAAEDTMKELKEAEEKEKKKTPTVTLSGGGFEGFQGFSPSGGISLMSLGLGFGSFGGGGGGGGGRVFIEFDAVQQS